MSERISSITACTFVAAVALVAASAHAAFILDDFDDPAVAVSPEMEGEQVLTQDVGPLRATRGMSISALRADPVASINSNVTVTSQLTGTMLDLNPDSGTLGASMGFSYEDILADFTEEGKNNAILIEFTRITGPTPPPSLTVLVRDTTHGVLSFFTSISPLPESSDAFTIAAPFDSFGARGGGSVQADFETIQFIGFSFLSNGFFGEPEELG